MGQRPGSVRFGCDRLGTFQELPGAGKDTVEERSPYLAATKAKLARQLRDIADLQSRLSFQMARHLGGPEISL